MEILVDTREQLPLLGVSNKISKQKLDVGDYTTKLLENKFHIERKSPIDLYGSIIQDHARFKRMLIRAQETNIKLCIMVECPREVFMQKKFPRGESLGASTMQLRKMLDTMEKRYGFNIVWCEGRVDMEVKLIQLFQDEERKLINA